VAVYILGIAPKSAYLGAEAIVLADGTLRGQIAENAGPDQSQQESHATLRLTAGEGKFINPVCGMAVSTTEPLHKEEYEGVSFYFCCDNCWTTFQKEPAKYAAIHRLSLGRVPA